MFSAYGHAIPLIAMNMSAAPKSVAFFRKCVTSACRCAGSATDQRSCMSGVTREDTGIPITASWIDAKRKEDAAADDHALEHDDCQPRGQDTFGAGVATQPVESQELIAPDDVDIGSLAGKRLSTCLLLTSSSDRPVWAFSIDAGLVVR